ncbi:glycosyltransferase [Methylophilaceae bacterium Uisw_099_01]
MEKHDIDFLIFLHRYRFENKVKKGGFDRVIDELEKNGKNIVSFENDLYTDNNYLTFSIRYILNKKETKKVKKFYLLKMAPSILAWISEIFINIKIAKKNIRSVRLIIGVDPLSFISAFFIRKFFFKSARLYFHAIDFTEKRFSNWFINFLYGAFYKFALVQADKVTVVSIKMMQRFNQIYKSDKYLFLPNSPSYNSTPICQISDKNPRSIVFSGALYYGIDYKLIVDALKIINLKYKKNFVFHVIGNGDMFDEFNNLIKAAGLKKKTKFHGFCKYEKSIEIIKKCMIGITYYSGEANFNEYGDSIKLREYAACGLPSVSDSLTSTSLEGNDMGCCILVASAMEMADAILKLLNDDLFYKTSYISALRWAKIRDKKPMVEKHFLNI